MNRLTTEVECPHNLEALYASSVRALTHTYPSQRIDEALAHIKLEGKFYDLMVHCKKSDPAKQKWQGLRAIAQRHCQENK